MHNKLIELKAEFIKEQKKNRELRKSLSDILYNVQNVQIPKTLNETKKQNSVFECILSYEDKSNKMMQIILNIRQRIEDKEWNEVEELINTYNVNKCAKFAYSDTDNIDVRISSVQECAHIEYNEDTGKTVIVL